MTIYLYKKTHRVTGLKYLGKTISVDPYSYTGSGIMWRKHLDEYGYVFDTEILRECKDDAELKLWGKYYSKLWNVAESTEWANLIEEAGSGGEWSIESKEKLSKTKKTELSKLSPAEQALRIKNSCSSPASWTTERIEKMKKGMVGKKKTKTPALLKAEEQRRNRTVEQKLKCGDSNRNNTWKLIDGKRVWITKENQNY
jgi:hypothetical protein